MKEGDLSKVFIGFMAFLCCVAGGFAVYRYRELQERIALVERFNQSLRKSEKVATKDDGFRRLVARSALYEVDPGAIPEPVEFIDQSSKKLGIRLEDIKPKAKGRPRGNLQEVAIDITENSTDITRLCELLFYLEEAYPGGLKVKEMVLQRKGEGDLWDARVVVSHFAEVQG